MTQLEKLRVGRQMPTSPESFPQPAPNGSVLAN